MVKLVQDIDENALSAAVESSFPKEDAVKFELVDALRHYIALCKKQDVAPQEVGSVLLGAGIETAKPEAIRKEIAPKARAIGLDFGQDEAAFAQISMSLRELINDLPLRDDSERKALLREAVLHPELVADGLVMGEVVEGGIDDFIKQIEQPDTAPGSHHLHDFEMARACLAGCVTLCACGSSETDAPVITNAKAYHDAQALKPVESHKHSEDN